jgi:hypothetical protein
VQFGADTGECAGRTRCLGSGVVSDDAVREEALTVVEISVGPLEAIDRANSVARWLLDTGIVIANLERDELHQPAPTTA